MFGEVAQFFLDGNNEILALVLTIALCVGPLILIWRSTSVADRPYDQYTSAVPGPQGGSEETAPNSNPTREVIDDQTFQTATFAFAGSVGLDTPDHNDPTATEVPVNQTEEGTSPSSPLEEPNTSSNDGGANEEPPTSSQDEGSAEVSASSDLPTLQPGHFYIRLKYLDETVRVVQAKPTDTIADFRRRNFSLDLSQRYRLIFQGQVLRNNEQTIQNCGIAPSSNDASSDNMPVVHCFLSSQVDNPNLPSSSSNHLQQTAEELNIGHFFLPLLGFVISFLWYLCIFYTTLFTIPSLFGVLGLSCFYIVLLVNRFL